MLRSEKVVGLKFDFSLFNNDFSLENLNNTYNNNKFLYNKTLNLNIDFLKSVIVERNMLYSNPDVYSNCYLNISYYQFFMEKKLNNYKLIDCTKEILIDRIIEYFVIDNIKTSSTSLILFC